MCKSLMYKWCHIVTDVDDKFIGIAERFSRSFCF